MRVRLLRDMRIQHKAGEVVEIASPAELDFLLSTGSAVVLRAAAPETPEANAPAEARETRAVRKTAKKRTT